MRAAVECHIRRFGLQFGGWARLRWPRPSQRRRNYLEAGLGRRSSPVAVLGLAVVACSACHPSPPGTAVLHRVADSLDFLGPASSCVSFRGTGVITISGSPKVQCSQVRGDTTFRATFGSRQLLLSVAMDISASQNGLPDAFWAAVHAMRNRLGAGESICGPVHGAMRWRSEYATVLVVALPRRPGITVGYYLHDPSRFVDCEGLHQRAVPDVPP